MSDNVKVLLTGDITGARDGAPWPPAGSVVELPRDEAQSLVHSGMAKAVNGSEATADLAKAAAVVLDAATEATVRHATTTRERQATSKRAHEPLNLGVAADEQPVEDDNGPRLPEVNGAEAAEVQDPATDTSSLDSITGETAPPSGDDATPSPAIKLEGKPTSQDAAKAKAAKDTK